MAAFPNSGLFTLNNTTDNLIHGDALYRNENILSISRKELFSHFGLAYCSAHIIAGRPITIRSKSRSFEGQSSPRTTRREQADLGLFYAHQKGRKYTPYFPRHGLPQVNIRIRSSLSLKLSQRSIGRQRFAFDQVDGKTIVKSELGEAPVSDLLCYKSLYDVQDRYNRHRESMLRESQSSYSKGVLFKDED